MAKFIDPFTDTGFKILFGKEGLSEEILMPFLNALFAHDHLLSNITSVRYKPSERTREWDEGKSIIYDVHCETSTGHRFILEMQLNPQDYFLKRAFYYCCRGIAEQGYKGKLSIDERKEKGLVKGSDLMATSDKREKTEDDIVDEITRQELKEYWDFNIVPVVGVFFTNFMIEGLPDRVITYSKFMDTETHQPIGEHMQQVFIQLPAFNKKEDECVSFIDQWLYNLINMRNMETMAFTSHQDVFNRLAKVANLATLSPAERDQYEYDLKKARDYRAELKYVVRKTEFETKKRNALNLLQLGVSPEIVAQGTKLPLEEVLALAKTLK